MARVQTQAIPQQTFLTVALNLLHQSLLQGGRTESKRLFRELAGGRTIELATVKMEDSSRARFTLSLDFSEYRGALNYTAFRDSLTVLLQNIAQALQAQKELRVFGAQAGPDARIFGVTGVTLTAGESNVMVLASGSGESADATMLRLMYLDPGQFAQAAGEASDRESA